jgi:single-strand DNA-binding protein
LSKGSPVFIEGRLKYDSWEKEGQKHSKLRVVGERMQFIGGRGEGAGSATRSDQQPVEATAAAPQVAAGPPSESDLPF